jgi:hypothetical protein
MSNRPLASLPDDELLRLLAELLGHSRRCESNLVAHIGEVDERGVYSREAVPSMFAYCVEVLHLSGAEAYLRIAAARAAREHPVLLEMLGDGRLHLSGIAKLAPILTVENRDALLSRAVHKSKRQIEELVAELAPRPDVPALMRRLPSRSTPKLELGPGGHTVSVIVGTVQEPARGDVLSGNPATEADQLRPDGVASSVTSGPRGPAAVCIPLQGAVHGERGTARQAGASSGPDAFGRAGRGSRRDHRAGGGREAAAAGGPGARRGIGSSTTTGTRSPWEETGARGISASCVACTTGCWPRSTTAGRRSPSIGMSERVSPHRPGILAETRLSHVELHGHAQVRRKAAT